MKFYIPYKVVGNGYPLILLHGWGWHAGIWTPVASELASQFTLYLIDLSGHGYNTEVPEPYSWAALAEAVFPHVPEQAHWLGWSLGGMLALWVAANHPQKVARLVTVASSPRFVETKDWPGVSTTTLDKFAASLLQDTQKTLRDFLALQLRGGDTNRELYTMLSEQLTQTPTPKLTALLGGLALLRCSDLRHDLFNLAIPSLHIFGQLDALVPARITNILQQQTRAAHFSIIKRCGHMPFLNEPEMFCTQVKDFLGDYSA